MDSRVESRYHEREEKSVVIIDGEDDSDQRSVHLSIGSDASPSRKATTVTDENDVIFFDTTPKTIVYPDHGTNVEDLAAGKGGISRKFILSVIVCSLILAIGLVAALIVLITPQLTKSENNKNGVSYSSPTVAPLLQITIPKSSYTYNYMHTVGTQIVDRRGQPIRLTGCNWYGFDTAANIPQGLWTRSYKAIIDQMKTIGFNTIRLSYSNQMLRSDAVTSAIDYTLNPDLRGLTPLQCMDLIVNYCGVVGIRVILVRFSSKADNLGRENYWYIPGDSYYTESRFIQDWVTLAKRYWNKAVIGADLWSSPKGQTATWGTGNITTDWNLAAERVGEAVQSVNSRWLIIVEGTGNGTWWGSNLEGVATNPIRLPQQQQLVYSVNEYANDTFTQTWFEDPNFPLNLRQVWNKHFGFIVKQNIAPVFIGEFGATLRYASGLAWITEFLKYINGEFTTDGINDIPYKQYGLSFTSWPINPYGGIGGILKTDWTSINTQKMYYLAPNLAPFITDLNNTFMPVKRPTPGPTFTPVAFDYFHTFGNQILDTNNIPVRITAVTWYGFELAANIPQGLWVRGYKSIIDEMKSFGYNTIRLTYTNQMLRSESVVSGVDYVVNKDLAGLSPLQCMDMIINYCGVVGLRVILVRYSAIIGNNFNEAYWYVTGDNFYNDKRFISDWAMLASRYRNTALIAADLWNSPKAVTWGSGNLNTDWLLACQRAGEAILAVNEDLLIIVEGTGWGSSLIGVADQTLSLTIPNKVVYSVQLYSNDTTPDLKTFSSPTFPSNLPSLWLSRFGFVAQKQIAPLFISEFGTSLKYNSDSIWMTTFIHFLNGYFTDPSINDLVLGSEGISWAAWPINPYGGIGGLLKTDWIGTSQKKLQFLNSSGLSFPLITSPNSSDTTSLPISTTFDPLYSFYVGSYDDVITQWLYTTERTIQFQGTYVTGLSSAPSWLSFSDDFKFLYATNEYLNRVQAYAVDEVSGALRLINEVPAGGGSPCYLEVNSTAGFLVVANYFSGNVSVIPIDNSTGALMPAAQVISTSADVNSHLQCAILFGNYLTVVDKGLDFIYQYKLSPTGGVLSTTTPDVVIQSPLGSGPIHIKFSPDGTYAVVLNSDGLSITVIPIADSENNPGLLFACDPVTYSGWTHPIFGVEISQANVTAAEIHISPNGRFVYVSTKDLKESGIETSMSGIVVFEVLVTDITTFPLTYFLQHVQTVSSQGNYPRYFRLLNGGTDLVLVNQIDNNFVSFAVDADTGMLDINSAVVSAPRSPKLLQPSFTLFAQ